ncbi:MAG: HEPN domain-containing protein [Prolixibacteraceae bacterium]|nr:HEPN domain-containing protein [Prolixibacteraceae bacterium]
MNKEQFDKQKIIDLWITGSNDDFETMVAMLDAKRYSWSLFLGHLVIEKLLKAYFVKINEDYPPYIHNLLKLAIESKIEITDDLKFKLTTISAFNLNARYDDYKRSFQSKCTPEYTFEWIDKIKVLRLWILERIKL